MFSSHLSRTALQGAIFFVSLTAQALSLGPLQVHSRLGQSLQADIEVSGTETELASLNARQASADAYARAGLEPDPEMRSIRVSVERKNESSALIRLRSERGFNSPIGEMLLETEWTGGRMQRDYTFLLDPPEALTAPVVAMAPPVPGSAVPQVMPTRAAAATVSSTSAESSKSQYQARTGDSLASVAKRHKADGVTSAQMMAAIYQSNPDGFRQGDPARLKAGSMLKLPSATEAQAIPQAEAKKLVFKGAGGFEAHRTQVAKAAQVSPAIEGDSSRVAEGQIKPVLDESATAGKAPVGKLRIAEGKKVAASTRKQIEALEDELASKSKALDEQNSRIAELEAMAEQLNKLIAMQQAESNAPLATAEASQAVAEAAAPVLETVTEPQPLAIANIEAPPVKVVHPSQEWYEDTLVQLIASIIAALALAWLAYRRYRESQWRKADREMQRMRGMPVDESVLSMA